MLLVPTPHLLQLPQIQFAIGSSTSDILPVAGLQIFASFEEHFDDLPVACAHAVSALLICKPSTDDGTPPKFVAGEATPAVLLPPTENEIGSEFSHASVYSLGSLADFKTEGIAKSCQVFGQKVSDLCADAGTSTCTVSSPPTYRANISVCNWNILPCTRTKVRMFFTRVPRDTGPPSGCLCQGAHRRRGFSVCGRQFDSDVCR